MASRHDSFESEDFERLSLTDSSYAKVIFNDVKDCYPANEDVNCTFTMMSSVEPMAGDKVALYKVGWSCTDDYIIALPCQMEKSQVTTEMSVTFSGSALPKDDGEYYQFCYITMINEIRGGSTPFVFKNSPMEDLFSEEDIENDLLLIQTRTSILEGSLQKAIKEKTGIQLEKQRLEEDCNAHKAKLLSFESLTKDQDEKIRDLELKLLESETNAATSTKLLEEEISQLNHFVNGMKIAVSAIGKEKTELEKVISGLQLENQMSKECVSDLHNQLDVLLTVDKALRTELKSKVETIVSLQARSKSLEEELSIKLQQINNLEKNQQEQQLQYNALSAQLADKEVMLAAMAASKSLAAEELQKYSKMEALSKVQTCCLIEECEKHKAQIDALEKEKIQLDLNLTASISENDICKKEINLLLEKQAELEKKSSKLTCEVKDLRDRLALGGQEYRRKYIDCHKMQNKVIKLQKKLSNLENNMQAYSSTTKAKQSADSANEQGCPSEAQDSNGTSDYVSSDTREDQMLLSSTKFNPASATLSHEQRDKLHAAMENQLQKFHGTKGSSNSMTDTCKNVTEEGGTSEAQSITSSTSKKPYPYPPYYPYPYPQGRITDYSDNSASCNSGNVPKPISTSPPPYTECRWLSSGSNEESFIMIPSPNTQVMTQEYIPRRDIYPEPSFEFQSDTRSQEEETGNISHRITCPICDEIMSEGSDINEHIDTHLFLKCPVCQGLFSREEYGMEAFNNHVLEHLD